MGLGLPCSAPLVLGGRRSVKGYRVSELWGLMYELGNRAGESWRLRYELEKQVEKPGARTCAYKARGEPGPSPAFGGWVFKRGGPGTSTCCSSRPLPSVP